MWKVLSIFIDESGDVDLLKMHQNIILLPL